MGVASGGRLEVDDDHGRARGPRRFGDGLDAGVDDLDRPFEEPCRVAAHRATSSRTRGRRAAASAAAWAADDST